MRARSRAAGGVSAMRGGGCGCCDPEWAVATLRFSRSRSRSRSRSPPLLARDCCCCEEDEVIGVRYTKAKKDDHQCEPLEKSSIENFYSRLKSREKYIGLFELFFTFPSLVKGAGDRVVLEGDNIAVESVSFFAHLEPGFGQNILSVRAQEFRLRFQTR